MALMPKPESFWVGNRTTIWSHLLVKHGMDERKANKELGLYFAGDEESGMGYEMWRDLDLGLEPNILTLGRVATG
jgi:hypothetical protein